MSLLEIHLRRPKIYYHCEIPGEAMPWKRPGQYHHNASERDQERILDAVQMACPRIKRDDGCTKWGIRFRFFTNYANVGDWDNLAKNICDALQGRVWQNDRMIREAYVVIVPHKRPRTEILLYPITDDYLAARTEQL